jgi:hypothetical protein
MNVHETIKPSITILLLCVCAVATIIAVSAPASVHAQSTESGAIWGTINYYTNSYVVVNSKQYDFHPHVTIDTYSLQRDKRGNVRLILDSYGAVLQLFFHGIDMPEAIERYKK